MALCRRNATAARRDPHKVHAGLPRDARCGLLFRLRGRPPAHHRRGRSPLTQPTSDHADGATLGRRDAKASQRPRRPVSRACSGTTAATGTGAVSVSVGDRTNPRRYTTIADGTSALQTSQRPRFAEAGTNPHRHSPREARCGLLFRPRGRPSADHRRGCSPSILHPRDHADGATLGRRHAKALRRTRRPELQIEPPEGCN